MGELHNDKHYNATDNKLSQTFLLKYILVYILHHIYNISCICETTFLNLCASKYLHIASYKIVITKFKLYKRFLFFLMKKKVECLNSLMNKNYLRWKFTYMFNNWMWILPAFQNLTHRQSDFASREHKVHIICMWTERQSGFFPWKKKANGIICYYVNN